MGPGCILEWSPSEREIASSGCPPERHLLTGSRRSYEQYLKADTVLGTRLLSILFITFIGMFALDVFGANLGFWNTLLALTIHLVPSLVLIGALAVAWRWEWIGAVIYTAAGMLYVVMLCRAGCRRPRSSCCGLR